MRSGIHAIVVEVVGLQRIQVTELVVVDRHVDGGLCVEGSAVEEVVKSVVGHGRSGAGSYFVAEERAAPAETLAEGFPR